jgi:organic hydroperoxide reductase OsmC/OhrA
VPARPRVLEFDVSVDVDGAARSALGGSPLAREAEWWAEHLVLAGLLRCTLASMGHAAHRAGLDVTGAGTAHGTVTKRSDDGLYALVDIETQLAVELAPRPGPAAVQELLAKAEHGCFVSNSLTARPRHHWIVNGQEVDS